MTSVKMVYDIEIPKLYAIDMDGTLTNGEAYWNGEECTPNQKMIKWVNARYKEGNYIIIYTARLYDEIRETVAWLIKHGVMYHGLNFDKMGADLYVDDKVLNVEDINGS